MRRALAILALLPTLGATCYRPEPPSPGIAVTLSGRITTEAGGSVTLDVALTDVPGAPVPVIVASADVAEGAVVDPGSGLREPSVTLQFTPADWNVPQRLTLVGVDDDARDGDRAWAIYVVVGDTVDAEYAALDATWLGLTNQDDDTPGIVLSRTTLSTVEIPGSTDGFTVRLAARPAATVTIPVTSGAPDEGLLRSSTTPNVSDPSVSLVFTPSDWSTPREVIVAGVIDYVLDGDQTYPVTVGPATGDAEYAALPEQTVSVTNRDVQGLGVECAAFPPNGWTWERISEIQSLTTGCVLRGAPTADVEVPFSSSDPSEALLSTGGGAPAPTLNLVFTPENWSVVQYVTLHGVWDHVWEPWAAGATQIRAGPIATLDEAYAMVGWFSGIDLYVTDVDTASPEGTASQPLDVGGQLPWQGMVDTTASYYAITGLAGRSIVSVTSVTSRILVTVDDDGDFAAGNLCAADVAAGSGFSCLLDPPASGRIVIRIDGSITGGGAAFGLNVQPLGPAPSDCLAELGAGTISDATTGGDPLFGSAPSRSYCLALSAEQVVTLRTAAPLSGTPIGDSLLYLLDPGRTVVAWDDDGAGSLYSLISAYRPVKSGWFIVLVTGYSSSNVGGYQLTVSFP